jgi:repressor LexA
MKKDNTLILSTIKSYLGFTKDVDFAKFLGIKPTALSNWYSRGTLDYDIISTKCGFIDGNWLLTGQGEILKTHLLDQKPTHVSAPDGIPVLPIDAFAGFGDPDVQGVAMHEITERYDIPLFYNLHVDFMVNVRGSSMYPKYSSGDMVACRRIHELLFVQWNKIYVIDSLSQGIIMKRLKKSLNDDRIICKSDNPKYEEFELPKSDIRAIALVVGSIRLE